MVVARLVAKLLDHGVVIPQPENVYAGPELSPSRIAPGAVLHPGCRLYGETTSIGPGCELGADGPTVIRDSALSAQVRVASGTVSGAVLLDGVTVGPNAHIRPGTLLEEEVTTGHAVGLKQTVLFPYVTLGSLINFCDVLMAGGTGPRDHGEVGSSYVHFNFTPYGDKATPSLVGDVPRGVLLNQRPIFLGGQGGLVGPCRLEYGTVIAAGTVWRRDALEPGLLLTRGHVGRSHATPIRHDAPRTGFRRIVLNNLLYLGNLHALAAWYQHIRPLFADQSPHGRACLVAAQQQIRAMIEERVSRLSSALRREARAVEPHRCDWSQWWRDHGETLRRPPAPALKCPPELRLSLMKQSEANQTYVQSVRELTEAIRVESTAWMASIVKDCSDLLRNA